MSEQVLTGRCLCGAVRYRAEGPPLRVTHCHCEQCRRAGGGVALTFGGFETSKVTFEGAPMKRVRSTDFASREFCPECGSPITFRFDARPEYVGITVGTFDEPEKTPATRHNFTSEKIPWVTLDPDLPEAARWWNPPSGKSWGAAQHSCEPAQGKGQGDRPDRDEQRTGPPVGRPFGHRRSVAPMLLEQIVRDQPGRQQHAERYQDHVIEVAEDRDEIRDQVDRAQRISGDQQRYRLAYHSMRGSRAAR